VGRISGGAEADEEVNSRSLARFSKIEDSAYRTALGPLQVLDFSRILAGPFATMTLADLGAEVTKVERPEVGDDTRSWGPPYDDAGEATYFQSVNRNKRSLALDLGDEKDLAEARRLALAADVLVENFRPGVMARLGLDYASLAAENPGLVYCSVTGFGSGAGAELPGYDLLVQALGGLMSVTGEPDGEPLKVGVALVDVIAGLFAAVGILAALEHRRASGEGQLVEVDLLSSLLAALVNQGSAYTLAGVVPERMGNRHPSIAPYELLAAAQGELVLAVGNDRQFGELCEAIGAPELAAQERFATNPARVANRDQLRPLLEAALQAKPASEWAALLNSRRVPAGVVNDVAGAFELAASIGLDPIVEIPRHGGEPARLTRNPIRFSKTPPSYRLAPPRLGSHRGTSRL
jgi:crotonobetainyl-CoA:carnitine CoA-transferase CaiB-like acyl-CoA transferase